MTYIFLGPSLPLQEAQTILDAHYLPPAKLGDVLTLVREKRPKVIGLIDGYFSQTLPVWHKEILFALEEGVTVLGSSSMGALRAAETDQFGMIGIGKIYELYRKGEIMDDDEVALIHGPAENHYLNLSLPMVNIRFTLNEAVSKGLISSETCQKWLEEAKRLYYPHRTLEEIAMSGRLSPEEKELLSHIFTTHYVDQKKIDAITLLRKISEGKIEKPVLSEPMHHTPLFQKLFHQDRSIGMDSVKLSLREIVKYVALHHPSFSQIRCQALNRVLVNVLAEIFPIEVDQTDIEREKERFKMKHDLAIPPSFEIWLKENHLSKEEFDQLMLERAKAQKLYSSPLVGANWCVHKAILDELKLNDQYAAWTEKAAAHQAAWQKSAPYYLEGVDNEIFENDIFSDHIQNSEWDLEVSVKHWCEEAGFHGLQELALELHKARLARRTSSEHE